jgi:predicted transcriptional regulator
MSPLPMLSRRERQIMDVVYRLGRVTATEVADLMADPPSNSAVRATMRILETKGHLRHEQDGPRYVYTPTLTREHARRGAMRDLLSTFFDGSPGKAVLALLDETKDRLTTEDLTRIAGLIAEARKRGR